MKWLFCIIGVAGLALGGCRISAPALPTLPDNYADSTVRTVGPDGASVEVTPVSPVARALADWVKWGAGLFVVGVVLMLPVFGGHPRTGALVAGGGVAMAAVGYFMGSLTVTLPAWALPSLVVLIAAGMVYGWTVREKQRRKEEGRPAPQA